MTIAPINLIQRVPSIQNTIQQLSKLSTLINEAQEDPKKQRSLAKYFEQKSTKKDEVLFQHAYSVFLLAALRHSQELRLNDSITNLITRKKAIKEDLTYEQILNWRNIYESIKQAIEFKFTHSNGEFTSLESKYFTDKQKQCSAYADFLLGILQEKETEQIKHTA